MTENVVDAKEVVILDASKNVDASKVVDDESAIPKDELKTLDPLPGWEAVPLKYDGWTIVHNSIRLDMIDFIRVTTALRSHFEAGRGQPWMTKYLDTWFARFYKFVHHHHDNEEDLFFPFVNKRVALPEKMSSDHPTLIAALDNVKAQVQGLNKAVQSQASTSEEYIKLIDTLLADFVAMQQPMEEHLQEEEDIGLPLLRANFTHKEVKKVEMKLVKRGDLTDVAHFLRSLEDDKTKWMWMSKIAKMPMPVRYLLWSRVKSTGKFYQKYTRLMDSIETGEQIPKPSWLPFGLGKNKKKVIS